MRLNTSPALLFVHGAGSSADFWHAQIEAFPEAHYVNLLEHGLGSPRAQGEHLHLDGDERGIKGYTSALIRFAERHELKNVILVGHSMGGAVVLTAALAQPEWLHALVLTGSGARFVLSSHLLGLIRSDYAAAVDYIIGLSFAPIDGALTYAQRIARQGARRKLLRTPQHVTLADYEACSRFDAAERLSEVKVPALVVVGEHDRLTPPSLSEELSAGIPAAQLHIVPGAGHMLPLEKPDAYNELVRTFVGEVGDAR
jgi:pimeloyl-ACP methyl ester carboxylesterase